MIEYKTIFSICARGRLSGYLRNRQKVAIVYLAHVIEQPNFRIPNPQYLQRNFCFDFFNDSENTF